MSAQNDRPQNVPGQPIPVPEHFPVTWENAEDQRLLWTFDAYHYPHPFAPLEFELTVNSMEEGSNRAGAEANLPFRVEARRINTYFYRAIIPEGAPPEAVIRMMSQVRRFIPGVIKAIETKAVAAVSQAYQAKLNPYIDKLEDYWNDTLLPEIKGYLADWEAFDLEGASMSELLAHLDQVLAEAERIGTIHFLIFGPYIFAMSQFDELYRDLFDGDGSHGSESFASFRLLQGFDNMILAGDRMLWQLGRMALTMPAVQQILESKSAADVLPALEESAAGQVFLESFNAFLQEHGQRGAMYSAIGEVSWLEDPTPVIKMLKDYITQPDRDLETEMAAEAAERERLVSQARNQLQGYPQPVVDEFERLLKAAQVGTVLHSDHAYWTDYRAMYGVRRVLLAVGQRLVEAHVIDEPSDVLFLWLAELKEAARDPSHVGKQELVAERKAEVEHFRTVKPPAALGTTPLLAPPSDDPLGRLIAKTSGGMLGDNGRDPGTLRGNAGSPGTVRGPARVVRSLAEAGKVQPGDILVAETTAPPWTPLFATVAAVVTDAGGVLSHCAVVAREYHIPAVVGVGSATDVLRDGQMVEVDGNAGVVRIV